MATATKKKNSGWLRACFASGACQGTGSGSNRKVTVDKAKAQNLFGGKKGGSGGPTKSMPVSSFKPITPSKENSKRVTDLRKQTNKAKRILSSMKDKRVDRDENIAAMNYFKPMLKAPTNPERQRAKESIEYWGKAVKKVERSMNASKKAFIKVQDVRRSLKVSTKSKQTKLF